MLHFLAQTKVTRGNAAVDFWRCYFLDVALVCQVIWCLLLPAIKQRQMWAILLFAHFYTVMVTDFLSTSLNLCYESISFTIKKQNTQKTQLKMILNDDIFLSDFLWTLWWYCYWKFSKRSLWSLSVWHIMNILIMHYM